MGELGSVVASGGSTGVLFEQRSWRPLAMVRSSLTWRVAIYLGVSLAFGLPYFIGLTVGLTFSLATLIIWIGFPALALTMVLWRGAAMLERRMLWAAYGVKIPDPYWPMPEGLRLFKRCRTMLSDPATWKDLAYLALRFPIAIVEFVASVALWFATAVFLFAPVISIFTGEVVVNFGDAFYYEAGDPFTALPLSAVGVLLLLISMYVTRVMGAAHLVYARFLLGAGTGQLENRKLKARADHLQASRARGVDAAESERRRIERDLHDGAQQRLLAVAMDIGRARAKLEDDPIMARELIEQAHAGTKEAISELRDLARGIYPAILTDRGLDPALSGLAARAPVPVLVEVELPDRPPAAVESIAYFIVAESLANIAKYARATEASVRVTKDQQWVVVEISDNGVGGAASAPGGGLAGLADRAATIDGILTVDSPTGGPTVIRADLPCSW